MSARTAGERLSYLDGFLAGLEEAAKAVDGDGKDVVAAIHAERIRTLAHLLRKMDRGLDP